MSSKLHLASGLELPLDVVTQKLAFLGRTGSGKTYGASKLAELMLERDAQLVALDPVGIWYGLRIGADGSSPGFKVPVFGGLHGDIMLKSTAGAVLADLVVDRGISAVLDVSQFETDAQKARFAEAFASRFFFRKKAAPSAVHVFLEECQEFVPQNPQGGDAQMLHAFTRLAKLGRNFGIGLSLISQRPQEINKKVLNMTEVMFAFQMRGPQERKTIKDWSSDKDLEVDIVAELPSLAVGEAFVSSPQWLQVEKRVKIAKKVTADVSSTPKVGAAARATRELTPIDLEQIEKTMAATIEKAKAEGPKELQKEIVRLKRELASGAKSNGKADPAAIERQVKLAVDHALHEERKRQDRYRRVLKQAVGTAQKDLESAAAVASRLPETLSIIASSFASIVAGIDEDWMPAPAEPLPSTSHASRVATTAPRGRVAAVPASPPRERKSSDATISGPGQRILDAIAFYNAIGVDAPTKAAVAAFCGVSSKTGTWSNRLSELRTAGLIEDPARDTITLTAAGAAQADQSTAPKSLADLHDRWLAKVSGPASKMLRILIDAYPDPMEKSALAAMCGVSHETGTWSNRLSKLRVPGLLEDVSRSEVRASDNLFPPGLS